MSKTAKKTKKAKKPKQPMACHLNQRVREAILIITSALALFMLLALVSYHRADWVGTDLALHATNLGGRAGAVISWSFLSTFGYIAYIFPFMIAYASWLYMRSNDESEAPDWKGFLLKSSGFMFILAAGCGISSLQLNIFHPSIPYGAGGWFGGEVGVLLADIFNVGGATLILFALFCTGVTLFTGLSWLSMIDGLGKGTLFLLSGIQRGFSSMRHTMSVKRKIRHAERARLKEQKAKQQAQKPLKIEIKKPEPKVAKAANPIIGKPAISAPKSSIKPSSRAQKDKQAPLFTGTVEGTLPSLSLLDSAQENSGKGYSHEQLENMSREVEERLKDFGITVQVVAVHPGPVITRFEMQLAPGVKVSRISGLAKDLARSLSVTSVRVVEVIPGKPVVGLELPNENREMVTLTEILSSQQYEQSKSPLTLALGKDISGEPMVADLAKMPHLLVAGTTGSGKSVGVNAMLMGLLFKSTPEDIRLILVDPKMLELSIYEGIPHLLTPVVTDMKEAANALRWSVAEMERRYRLMSEMGVRNLAGFNKKIKEAIKNKEPIADPLWRGEEGQETPTLRPLPAIVIVIDEFADMMMVVGKKVEQLIARIAQKARAAGIHLILATQRPSVDVITGLIKANVPSRIAFQVSSKIDSRTVLDQGGAEQLLGHGDMLYLPAGTSVPTRVHGAFVSDEEVHRAVDDWKKRGAPEFIEEILSGGSDGEGGEFGGGSSGEGESDKDPLYDEAVYVVTKTRKASISGVQRRLKIGYNRAARLVEQMEEEGVVSSMESNGSREVLAPPPPE